MRSVIPCVVFAVCLSFAAAQARSVGQASPGSPFPTIEAQLLSGTTASGRLFSVRELRLFYEERGQRPAWRSGERLSPQIEALQDALRTADREGLRPADYHLAAIDALIARLRGLGSVTTPAAVTVADDLDLLLSDAFFLYASHLTTGRVSPTTVEPEWNITGRGRNLTFLLATALKNGHLAATLAALPPTRDDYRLLREALAAQRAIAAAGGWPPVPGGSSLREGDRGPRVALLRQRLAATGELAPGADTQGEAFDPSLTDALRRFQVRHGLEPDAIAGRLTLAALNVPALQRARQIEANLERLRWLPRDLGPRHLLVNLADFSLTLTEPGAPTLAMRVIAGRLARRTPFITGEITSILLNPSWTVPERLAVEDKLPLIIDDPLYLAEHGFKVFARSGDAWREIDPAAVDWTSLSATRFPYRLRQEPGPGNALGRIKFQIPNRHDIYLHDTPSPELFAHAERAFSSGCIRVERAVDLAERLLAADPAWTRARIEETIAAGLTVSVRASRAAAGLPALLDRLGRSQRRASTARRHLRTRRRPARGARAAAGNGAGINLWQKPRPEPIFAQMSEEHKRQSGPHRGDLDRQVACGSRRSFLALAAWGLAAIALPKIAAASFAPPAAARRLSFYNRHTDESVETCYWEHGAYVPTALEQLNVVLRDHRTGDIRPMSPALIDLVYALSVSLGSRSPVQVISGYRSPATNALLRAGDPGHVADRSLHITGEAVDLCFEDRSLSQVRDTALALRGGGVGYYPRSGFVHVDVGRLRSW